MRLYLTATLLLIGVLAQAQQRAQYTQYIMNNYVLNPAAGGINNYWDLKMGFRTQWTALEGGPQTVFVSMHGPLGYPDKRVRNGHLRAHQGIGGYVFRDVAGPISMTGAYLSYSYHAKLSEKITASAGAFLGILQNRLNADKLLFLQNPDDPSIGDGKIGGIVPDGTLGLWVHSDKVFVGLSANQLFRSRTGFTTSGSSEGRLNYHYFITAGYKIKASPMLDVIPSTMVKYVYAAPMQLDVNLRLKYNNMFWAGVSYRKEDALAILVGFIYDKKFEVGYSYDLTTSKLRAASWGSHEIILGFNFARLNPKQKRALCPMDYWN